MSQFADWNRIQLIRQWWYLYRQILEGPMRNGTIQKEFDDIGDECERRGIIKLGKPMPRDGAHDLADACDEFKRKSP